MVGMKKKNEETAQFRKNSLHFAAECGIKIGKKMIEAHRIISSIRFLRFGQKLTADVKGIGAEDGHRRDRSGGWNNILSTVAYAESYLVFPDIEKILRNLQR